MKFAEFWPYYLREHRKPATRWCHFCGTTASLAMLGGAIGFGDGRLVGAALLCGYGPAWFSHFFIEKNRPATFKYPWQSLVADFKMWEMMLSGRLDADLKRALEE